MGQEVVGQLDGRPHRLPRQTLRRRAVGMLEAVEDEGEAGQVAGQLGPVAAQGAEGLPLLGLGVGIDVSAEELFGLWRQGHLPLSAGAEAAQKGGEGHLRGGGVDEAHRASIRESVEEAVGEAILLLRLGLQEAQAVGRDAAHDTYDRALDEGGALGGPVHLDRRPGPEGEPALTLPSLMVGVEAPDPGRQLVHRHRQPRRDALVLLPLAQDAGEGFEGDVGGVEVLQGWSGRRLLLGRPGCDSLRLPLPQLLSPAGVGRPLKNL